MTNPKLCIKIGGRALEEHSVALELSREIAALSERYRCVVVHGGGARVSKVSEHFGLAPKFVDGVRLTSVEEMDVVDMVLRGSVNASLVRMIGARAVGLAGCDGALFTGLRIAADSHTGRISEANPALLDLLTKSGYVPIVSSVSVDPERAALNINADEAALAIAVAFHSEYLVFISDIDGVMREGKIIPTMTRESIESAIEEGVITGGMIPKVRSSVSALERGIGSIAIGSFERFGDIENLIAGRRGSSIQKEQSS